MSDSQITSVVDDGQVDHQEQQFAKPIHTDSAMTLTDRSAPSCTLVYKNNLLWAVGLLELSNAMDFPANVFNSVPVPVFAQVLMGLGGSIAILWTVFTIIDARRAYRNVKVLMRERRFLKTWQHDYHDEDSTDTRRLVQAILDVNLREVGWECVDRLVMDVCAGISGVLVGSGALMAIRGDEDDVFTASNLLSGYIGNSFLAPYALLSILWTIFMFRRASESDEVWKAVDDEIDPDLRQKMAHHAHKHKVFAVLNGFTAAVGTAGSIMSSTLWHGYILIAPCVFTLLFCNLFWRYHIGYSRDTVQSKAIVRSFKLETTLTAICTVEAKTRPSTVSASRYSKALAFLGGLHDYDVYGASSKDEESGKVEASSDDEAVTTMRLTKNQRHKLVYRQRHLLEVYGRYVRQLKHVEATPGTEK